MRLATLRTDGGTAAVRVQEDVGIETGHDDVGELLRAPDWHQLAEKASGPSLEMGRELPEFPTLFAKFPPALVGAYHEAQAAQAAIAGYSILNDVTARDWQYRTPQWLQGKTFEASTALGPFLVTPDDAGIAGRRGLDPACEVDGQHKQAASTADLVFEPAALVSYISSILTLLPGDVIATGTPGGVGHARNPRQYLTEGSVLFTRIEGLGHCRNTCRAEKR